MATPAGARTLAQQRQERILLEVRARGAARVAELAELLDVSDMTVRRDLDALDAAGLLVKVHGGATAPPQRTSDEPGFDAKMQRSIDEKRGIAAAAAPMVSPGAAIAITAGTTTWRLATELVDVADLTVVTNSIRVAEVFYAQPRADRTIILTGGVRTPSDALVGPIACGALDSLHVDLLFCGVHGMSERAGFSTPNMMEAETNRSFFRAAGERVVLADHTKWGVTGLSSFAPLDGADVVVSDDALPRSARAVLEAHVDEVVLVTPPPPASPATDTGPERTDEPPDQTATPDQTRSA
jgi:DeoR/GlpR family transcriptional regulator of sugar metabolism